MMKRFAIVFLTGGALCAAAVYATEEAADKDAVHPTDSPAAGETQPAEGTAPAADYVEREEKVVSATTGRAEKERVIEFKETEISGALARPVEIIIPRHKPDFNKITLTIYNNEPPHFTPDEYKLSYYRRVPVREDAASDEEVRSAFTPTGETAAPAAGDEKEKKDNPPPQP